MDDFFDPGVLPRQRVTPRALAMALALTAMTERAPRGRGYGLSEQLEDARRKREAKAAAKRARKGS